MTRVRECEAKVLGIDPYDIAQRISDAGGAFVSDRLMRRYVYDLRPPEPGKWVRLRDSGTEVTICVKEIVSSAVDGVLETELAVMDFDAAHGLLQNLGFTAKAYQENRRASWRLGATRLEIDSWPLIPPYLEIEGDGAEDVYQAVKLLGFGPGVLTSENTTDVYRRYGIDLEAVTELRFPAQTEK
ncbi:class IV adenylate cyclase [Streptomyces millisiae]|uniref:Adenylate cyclase n=1 Tax=Streptomyces millisiae TaxID=3075542 RepID=A0ABU2LPV1_9ACTN|nr:adenylate cyclase [Streptomyces sp. DSM 44918]MDT0319629.1 adenylate cyclase [Streptomyces sp. DSM 44918]